MKNRIQVDGVWYVREDQVQESFELNPVKFDGIVVENENYCFEATRIHKDDNGGYYKDSVDIKFTDKRIKPWKEDYWDNNDWMRRVLENNSDSIKELPIEDPKDIKYFQSFLQYLKDEEWL